MDREHPAYPSGSEEGPAVVQTLLRDWFNWSGLRAVCLKFIPEAKTDEGRPPATGVLWLIGVYTALFGLGSGRYELQLNRIDSQKAAIYSLLGTETRKQALERIPAIQRMTVATRPDLFAIQSISASILHEFDGPHEESVEELKTLLSEHRSELAGMNLIGVDLTKSKLNRASLQDARLYRANFRDADLFKANLSFAALDRSSFVNANLQGANLAEATLMEADLSGAILWNANFSNAAIHRANFNEARLHGAAGLDCARLQGALNWERAFRDADLACGEEIPRATE